MSSMLEQAIVDAQALREAALKNAEQALIEKFAPQIKDAVESLLEENQAPAKRKATYEGQVYSVMEVDGGKATIQKQGEKPFVVSEAELSEVDENLLQEEEMTVDGGAAPSAAVEAPFAGSPVSDPDQTVEFSVDIKEPIYEFDLQALKNDLENEEQPDESMEGPSDLLSDLGGEEETEAAPDEEGDDLLGGLELQESLDEGNDELVNEIMNLMNEMYDEDETEVLEEELIVDMGEVKDGTFRTDKETLEYYKKMQKAKDYAEAKAEENEGLKETLKRFKLKNKQYKDAVEKLSEKLNETMLSNAKLIYSNKTLGDASLNERQKNKIVEAIAKARTPEEAKNLHEALNATVTSGQDKKSPRTLSESVQRKSTLSGILPRRNKQVNESEEHTFADHMKKLAGIK
tara:strand:- start:281 stop:1489 length:1209 start_codon:yes stop_codon:yes gene_type:complete